jgi:hypothetical protein
MTAEEPSRAARRARRTKSAGAATAGDDGGRKPLLLEEAADLEVAHVKEVVPAPEGMAIVIRAEARRGDQRTELEIAITTDLAPSVAIALLATTAKARALRDDLEPALDCLVADAAVVSEPAVLRLKLLFDKGSVLPVEMPVEAGIRLREQLDKVLAGAGRPRN